MSTALCQWLNYTAIYHSQEPNHSVSTHSRTSIAQKKRRFNSLSRTELRSRTTVPNRIAVSIHRKLQAKAVAVVFCIGAVTPTEQTLRQSTNRNAKAKLQCFSGCCNRCYIPHWRRLLNILNHMRMLPCPKNYITHPVCRRVTLNRRFRRHESRLLLVKNSVMYRTSEGPIVRDSIIRGFVNPRVR